MSGSFRGCLGIQGLGRDYLFGLRALWLRSGGDDSAQDE